MTGVERRFRKKSLIALVSGLALVAGAVVAVAQSRHRTPGITVGIARWNDTPEYRSNVDAFIGALADGGYVRGRDVRFVIEDPAADSQRQRAIIGDFRDRGVDLIYSLTTPGTLIARDIAPEAPIVFSIVTYPVEAGLVQSLDRSGNNLVGTRNWVPARQQLALFHEIAPGARRIAFAHHAGEPNSRIQRDEFRVAARIDGTQIIDVPAADLAGMRAALASAAPRIDAVYGACDTLIQGGGEDVVVAFARAHRIPALGCLRSTVQKGALIGAIADPAEIGRLAGQKAAAILRGASPSSIPTTGAARPFIYVNQHAADVLGLVVPQSLLARAKAVIIS